jgi:hypothetical protein
MPYYPPTALPDGDYGEVVVSDNGATFTLDHYLIDTLDLLNFS